MLGGIIILILNIKMYCSISYTALLLKLRSVVSTLLRRAQNTPSTQKGKREETKQVKAVLRDNNCLSSFINSFERSLSELPADLPFNGVMVLPNVQGNSERISRILTQQQIKAAFKPLRTVNSLFSRPKGWHTTIWHCVQNQLNQLQFCILRSN